MNLFFRKLTWLAQRRRKEAELREELEFHLSEEGEELKEQGLTPEHARWAAHRELGNVVLLQENMRTAWIWTFWERLLQDVRYATRMMLKNPTFTLVATLLLALGIGANTAIYSFMDSLLLRALPVSDPASLAVLKWHNKLIRLATPTGNPEGHGNGGGTAPTVMHSAAGWTHNDPKLGHTGSIFPFPAFELLRDSNSVFSDLFAYYPAQNLNIFINQQAEMVQGEYVSGDYFRGLGISPAAGRLITADDDKAGAPTVAVVSLGFSQRYFGGPANATGKQILINNFPATVVGVTPPEFFGVDPSASPEIYLPLHNNV
jgi:macrolide transport system ATP-binding/permease protein